MPRGPNIPDYLRRAIVSTWRRNREMTAKEVHQRLQEDFLDYEPFPSIRAVQSVLTNARKWEDPAEAAWRFHSMMASGDPPPEAAQLLLDVSRWGQENGRVISQREARWCWLVFCAAPTLAPHEVLSIASYYAFEEQLSSHLSEPELQGDQIEFMNALLAYRPWVSEEKREEFVRAIPAIVPYPSNFTWIRYAFYLGATPPKDFSSNIEAPEQLVSLPPPMWCSEQDWTASVEQLAARREPR